MSDVVIHLISFNRMKIEIVVLFAIICVSAAEFNNTTTAIPITKNKRPQFVTIHYNATESQQGKHNLYQYQ